MALVAFPNSPGKGVSRWNVAARCQSTVPQKTGMIAERKASTADIVAIGTASLPAHLTPARFTSVNSATIPHAIAGTEAVGRNHCLIAEAESRAVNPQVGTHPHQYETPVKLASTSE